MNIYCIIVCYYPEIHDLSKICSSLLYSKAKIILVDNTENCYIERFKQHPSISLISCNENIGIAKAQNLGIKYAIEKNADVLVFFDQDSKIDDFFISQLTNPFIKNQPMVVAPVFYDKAQGFRFPNYRLNRWGLLKELKCLDNNEIYHVDMIISSGSAVSKEVFNIVGLMNEDYFIDYVDTEWILRCRSKNIPILVNPKAKMIHSIGEKSINLHFIRLFVHGHVRSYYKIRNSFLFMKSKHVPVLMGIKEVISALLHNFLIIFFVKKKYQFIKNYLQAVKDGLLNKKGKK